MSSTELLTIDAEHHILKHWHVQMMGTKPRYLICVLNIFPSLIGVRWRLESFMLYTSLSLSPKTMDARAMRMPDTQCPPTPKRAKPRNQTNKEAICH